MNVEMKLGDGSVRIGCAIRASARVSARLLRTRSPPSAATWEQAQCVDVRFAYFIAHPG